MENESKAVKVQFGDDIRRFSLPSASFDTLRSIILEAYPELKEVKEWRLKYKDEEGDSISITCDSELSEALRQPLLRLTVATSEAPAKSQEEGEKQEPKESKPQESAEPTQPQPPIDLERLISAFLQPQTGESQQQQCPLFDPKLFLPIWQQNQQQIMSLAPMLLQMVPQLLSDPAVTNSMPTLLNTLQSCPTAVPTMLSVLQQNPAMLNALPQLINTVASNPALIQMLPLFLGAQQGQQQQQQQFYTPQQPQQQTAYTPQPFQPWNMTPSPSWQQPEFQPQMQGWPFRLFQPQQTQQPQPSSTQDVPPSPTFSFGMPGGSATSPSFTFGQTMTSTSSSSSTSSSAPPLPNPEEVYQVELSQLEAMGFTNREANKALLLKNNGDLVAVIQDLTAAGL